MPICPSKSWINRPATSALFGPLGACLYSARESGCCTSTWCSAPPSPRSDNPAAPKSTAAAYPTSYKPMVNPKPPGGERRARWLAAVHCRSIEDDCRSGALAWCSQPWPAPLAVPPTSTKHALRAHRPVQCTGPGRRVGASSVSGRRPEYLAVAPRSGRGQPAPATGSAATIPIVHPRGKESFLPFCGSSIYANQALYH